MIKIFQQIAEKSNISKLIKFIIKFTNHIMMDFGLESIYFFTPKTQGKFSLILRDEHNPLNENRKKEKVKGMVEIIL